MEKIRLRCTRVTQNYTFSVTFRLQLNFAKFASPYAREFF